MSAVRGHSTSALWLAWTCPKASALLSSTPNVDHQLLSPFCCYECLALCQLRDLLALIVKLSSFLLQRLAADENDLEDSTSGGLILNSG